MNRKKLRNLYFKLAGPITFVRYFNGAIAVSKEESYFPEMERKSIVKRFCENLIWLAKYHEVNDFYNLYGFDIVDFRSQMEYVDYQSFMLKRNDDNRVKEADSQTVLLRDKLLFYKFMKSSNLPVPNVFAIYENEVLYDTDLNEIDEELLINKRDYFIKDIEGECASFVKHIKDFSEFKSIRPRLVNGKYILQEKVTQCKEMERINPKSLNTLRLITSIDGNVPHLFTQFQRFGTERTGNVDNWAVGGYYAEFRLMAD